MENVPIPNAPEEDRQAIAELAKRSCDLGLRRYQLETNVYKRMTSAFGENSKGEVEGKLNQKAEEWWEQTVTQSGGGHQDQF